MPFAVTIDAGLVPAFHASEDVTLRPRVVNLSRGARADDAPPEVLLFGQEKANGSSVVAVEKSLRGERLDVILMEFARTLSATDVCRLDVRVVELGLEPLLPAVRASVVAVRAYGSRSEACEV